MPTEQWVARRNSSSHNDSVSPFRLGAIQGLVRRVQQLFGRGVTGIVRDADGESHASENLAGVLHGQMFEVFAQQLRPPARGFSGCTRENESELLSPVAASGILASSPLNQKIAQRAQKRIAGLVAKRIVEPFEVIDVKHEKRQGLIVSDRASQLPLQRLFHVATVEKPGQGITKRLAAKHLTKSQIRQGQRDPFADGGGLAAQGFHLIFWCSC